MSDQKQLFLFGQTLPGNESGLLERMRECAEKRNKSSHQVTPALQSMPADRIKQMVVGASHIAFLLTDNRVARLSFEVVTNIVEPPIPTDKNNDNGPSGSGTGSGTSAAAAAAAAGSSSTDPATVAAQAAANAASRTAKIRRIMMTRPGVRSGSGFCRTGVMIDRNRSSRPVIPASSVPEELIVQCQVVLQGKSREVIVRELQRTNLNVNEAVNNLLSRDDDEIEDLDETSEAYLHEELLSLLDAGLRSDGGEGYEYIISRDLARRREALESKGGKDTGKESGEAGGQTLQEQFVFGDVLEIWGSNKTESETQFQFPAGVSKFTKIASMNSELLALADDGQLYGWLWASRAPANSPHPANSHLLIKDTEQKKADKIADIESCGLRAAVLTQSGLVGSFMDACCGLKLAEAFLEVPVEVPESVAQLFCCTLFTAILTKTGTLYWRGIYPFNERRKIWEKARSKKKQVTSSSSEIVVGSEVRTKSTPIYSVGSVAVNFTSGTPMIGTLYEDAWTLNETCRFRVQTPESYDNSPARSQEKDKQREKRVSFSLAVGNRKRAAPTASDELAEGNGGAEAQPATSGGGTTNNGQQQKESAWAIKDVVFIHEEAVNDINVVKIVDGAYVGVVFKSTLERLERESAQQQQSPMFDLNKMGIRLMRKDDLIPISNATRGAARSPENFQSQFKSIRLPSGIKRIISLAVDGTGFRILAEKNTHVHLLRISCVGKLLSDHLMPINLNSLCRPIEDVVEQNLPAVKNYGDENILLLCDSSGAFQPLLRNAAGGFQELAFTGLGRFYQFGMGIRYLKTPGEFNAATICTEPSSVSKSNGTQSNKNATRMLLMAVLIAPSPHSNSPKIESLMQSILNCDLNSVREILQKLNDVELEQRRSILNERIEGNRNIFHIAALNAFAKTNRDQADVEPTLAEETTSKISKWAESKWDSNEAEAARARFDRKWHEMLGGSSAPTTRAKAHQAAASAAAAKEAEDASGAGASSSEKVSGGDSSAAKSEEDKIIPSFSPIDSPTKKSVPLTPKERQANGIEITRELCKSSVLQEYFLELMQQTDINGQTPFQCAIHFRAYTAAHLFWETAMDLRDWSQDLAEILAPICADQPDDSALFALCANDTCSYTWTGEEHTPQDIFECRTCGLVGTLCCCTECAYTCHRSHDCKPKRTSPTAYCDCWEKYGCRAIITGNLVKREKLLNLMLQNGKLIGQLNSRGEHLLLFLAKTVGRQLVEQESYVKRSKRPAPTSTVTSKGLRIPEHDLEPPKFSRRALELTLSNWEAVKSLLEIGTKSIVEDMDISETTFHLTEHNGSTHLDKFVFTLLAYCDESSLDNLLNLFIRQANRKSAKDPDSAVHHLISRFVRSVIRLFVLVLLLSPNAIGALLATISENISKAFLSIDSTVSGFSSLLATPSQQLALSSSVPAATPAGTPSIRESLQNYRAVAISGMLSLVRASLPGLSGLGSAADKKDVKKKNVICFMTKCRRVFQALLSYSLNELIGMADTLVAPLRYGIVKPTSTMTANDDVFELIQKHLNSEHDLSSLLKEVAEGNRNLANIMANSRFKKLVEMRNTDAARPEGRTGGANEDQADHQPSPSEDEMSNDEDEDDEEMIDGAGNQSFRRVRENSSASIDRTQRERTVSGGGRRERQGTGATEGGDESQDAAEEDQPMATEDEHDEEDEDASEHEMEEDEEDEPYFDVHDDDDEEDDDASEETDENPSDVEGADSNDTATVAVARDGTAAIGEEEGDLRIELVERDAVATNAAAPAVEATQSETNVLGGAEGTTGTTTQRNTDGANNNNNNNNNGGTAADSAARTSQQPSRTTDWGAGWGATPQATTTTSGTPRESAMERNLSSSRLHTHWRTSAPAANTASTPATSALETATTTSAAAAAVSQNNPNDETVLVEDNQYSQSNTSTQLALCFSVLVKLIDELLVQLMSHAKWKQHLVRAKGISSLLDLEPELYPEFKNLLTCSFGPTWDWLSVIMDRTEAQLKYSQAVSHSLVGPDFSPPTGPDREDHLARVADSTKRSSEIHRRYRKKAEVKRPEGIVGAGATGAGGDPESNAARAESFDYFMSLLRSYSAENGDDLPVLEYNALRNVAFIAEAYFFHLIFMDQLKQLELESGANVQDADETGLMEVDSSTMPADQNEGQTTRKLRRFYQRSNSISYPLLSLAEGHHAFSYTAADALPLSARSHLLTADAERESLFALPTPIRSRTAHKEIASEQGVQFPTHQSLSRPPLKYAELVQQLPPSRLQKQRSSSVIVKHYGGGGEKEREREEDKDTEMEQEQQNNNAIGNILLNNRLGLQSSMQRMLGRWSNTVTMFTRTFHEELTNRYGGDSSFSVLLNKTGVCSFAVRHAQFRKQMDKLKNAQTKDLIFSQMSREKHNLLQQTFRQLNQIYVKRLTGSGSAASTPSQSQTPSAANEQAKSQNPLLASHKVKVTFRDEPGEGTGVARHFYAALADAFTTIKHLPQPDNVNEDGTVRPATPAPASGTAESGNSRPTPVKSHSSESAAAAKTPTLQKGKAAGAGNVSKGGPSRESAAGTAGPALGPADTLPLFYRSSKTGFYTPISGSNSPQRLNAFRNIGRLIGICLQHTEIIPLPLCRHVLKFILSRPLNWFDLAFFDPSLFDSLRTIVYNEESDEYHPSEFYEQLEMTFSVDLPMEEGGGTIELKPDGVNIAVTRENVLEYIYLFVEQRLLGIHKPCLEAIRRGVFDVVPADALANMTSEDLRLILCGTQEVSIPLLQNFTKFLDESSAPADILAKYKKTFWSVVNKLGQADKQDLCFFWTGSPSLPSTEEGFQPLPTIMIRPADDQHLPTANTCISRLYLPLYSSKKLLKEKLGKAIKARNFGFV